MPLASFPALLYSFENQFFSLQLFHYKLIVSESYTSRFSILSSTIPSLPKNDNEQSPNNYKCHPIIIRSLPRNDY